MSSSRFDLREKARRAIVQYAIFRWENAVVLAGTIVLTGFFPHPFPWWPVWGWPLLGLIGIAAIFTSSLTNVEANAALLMKLSQEEYDVKKIKLPELRKDVELALEYQQRIQKQVQEKGAIWVRPEDTANQLDKWIENLYRLARRLDAYRRDTLIQNQLTTVPKEIEQLANRRKNESNPVFERELDDVLESKKTQLETLQALADRMRQAELQLAQTLSAMATVDSQVKLIDAQDVDSSRSENLRSEIREEIEQLNDLISSINEVYDYHSPGMS
jgi:hypothetical protein